MTSSASNSSPPTRRRTVVTGQGLVTPLGRNTTDIWEKWSAGQSAAEPMSKADLRSFSIGAAAEVRDFEPRKEIRNRKLIRLMIGGEAFGFVAATKAFDDSGLSVDDYLPERAGVAIGCHKEGFRNSNLYDAIDAAKAATGKFNRRDFIEEGMRRIPPQTLVEGLANAALYYFAHEFVLQGVNHNFLSSGTGGSLAIGEAMRSMRRGEADVMLAGGYDSWIDWLCVGHQRYIKVLCQSDGAPATLHRPFSPKRDGAVPGEGAGMLVLEERDRALARGATIHGEILGFALTTGLPLGDREGYAHSLARCIRRALADAGCDPTDIDLIHLHGDATIDGDWIEARATRQAFGDHADVLPATTIKSATGLLGNASGPVDLLMTLEMLRRGEVLPAVNFDTPDPELSLNYVTQPLSGLTLKRAIVLQRSWPSHFTATIVGR